MSSSANKRIRHLFFRLNAGLHFKNDRDKTITPLHFLMCQMHAHKCRLRSEFVYKSDQAIRIFCFAPKQNCLSRFIRLELQQLDIRIAYRFKRCKQRLPVKTTLYSKRIPSLLIIFFSATHRRCGLGGQGYTQARLFLLQQKKCLMTSKDFRPQPTDKASQYCGSAKHQEATWWHRPQITRKIAHPQVHTCFFKCCTGTSGSALPREGAKDC